MSITDERNGFDVSPRTPTRESPVGAHAARNGIGWAMRMLNEHLLQPVRTSGHLRAIRSLQAMRGSCMVRGVDRHSWFGLTPLGPGQGDNGFWYSTGTADDRHGSDDNDTKHAPSVFACSEPLLQKRHRAVERTHLFLGGTGEAFLPPGAPTFCPPMGAAGFGMMEPALGECIDIGGPRSVVSTYESTDSRSVAVLLLVPGASAGPANHLLCWHEDDHLPTGLSSQSPSSVFLGMPIYEMYGTYLRVLIDNVMTMIVNYLIDKAVEGVLEWASDGVWGLVPPRVRRRLQRFLSRRLLRPLLHHAREWIKEKVQNAVSSTLGEAAGRYVRDAMGTDPNQTLGQQAEYALYRWMEGP